MCKYCNVGNGNMKLLSGELADFGLMSVHHDIDMRIEDDWGGGEIIATTYCGCDCEVAISEVSTKILFCPFCGRRFGEE